jgi:hypothetical protein
MTRKQESNRRPPQFWIADNPEVDGDKRVEPRFDVTYKGIYYRNICGRTAGNEPVTPPSCLEVGSSAQDRKLYVRPKGS